MHANGHQVVLELAVFGELVMPDLGSIGDALKPSGIGHAVALLGGLTLAHFGLDQRM